MDAPLTIGLFGPMRVLIGGEPMPHVRSRKALWLMALLVLRGGRPASRDALASALWPDADADVALSNLRPIVSELRRALGTQGERLRAPDRKSLVFDLDGAEADVAGFDRAMESGDAAHAVALYSGALLEGCPEEWAHQERNAREADCLKALGRLADEALSSGDPHGAADLYARAGALDPTQEECRRGQMAALAAMGDVNAALEIYREFAQALRAEIGLAPEPETTALYERLRASGRKTNAAKASDVGNLPRPADDLIGRDDEQADVAALLRKSPLVTLTGPGGIGKTRLAIAVAHGLAADYPDGAWFVALEGLKDGGQLASALAETLGVREARHRSAEAAIRERLQSRRALLVLDNCEHLLPDCARLCGDVLAQCAEVRVLATSREPLGLKGERPWAVPSLAFPDPYRLPSGRTTALRYVEGFESVQLFLQRVRALVPSFELNPANTEAVASICARLEGVPLSIELAAAQTRRMGVAQVAERLDDSLRLLTAGFRARLGRQHALRATIDWSYELLDEDERRLLGKLSVFANGWVLEAARAVGGDRAEETLASLVEKSLVGFDLATDRYRLLETVRQYASEKLSSTPRDEGQARRRRAQWCVELAETGDRALGGPDPSKWLDRIQNERGNLLAALSDLEANPQGGPDGLRLTGALWRFWNIRGPRAEGIERLRRALDHSGAQDDSEARAQALNTRGILLYHSIGPSQARPWFEAAVALRQRLGEHARTSGPLSNLGNVLKFEGDHAGARRLYEECIALTQSKGDRFGEAMTTLNLGNLLIDHLGETVEAGALYDRALALLREIGEPRGIAIALEGVGLVALAKGEFQAAQACHEEALSTFERLHDQRVAWSLYRLGEVALAQGGQTLACEYYERSLALFMEQNDYDGIAFAYQGQANALLAQGRAEEARAKFASALSWRQQCPERKAVGGATVGLALAEFDLGLRSEGAAHLAQAIGSLRNIDARRDLALALDAAARLLVAEGDPWSATRLLAAADAERFRTGSAPSVPDRERNLRTGEEAKARLGSSGFAAAWEDGGGLSLEDAATEALRAVESQPCLR